MVDAECGGWLIGAIMSSSRDISTDSLNVNLERIRPPNDKLWHACSAVKG